MTGSYYAAARICRTRASDISLRLRSNYLSFLRRQAVIKILNFRFVKHPEYLKVGQRLVFREGRTKAVGNVTKIVPHIPLAGGATTSQTTRAGHQKAQKMVGRNQRKKEEELVVTV